MVEFGGWEMPLQYAGVIKEQNSVRQNAGIFDISHMGEISITGKGARSFLNRLVTNDILSTSPSEITYTLMLNENGGTIDDLLVYTIADDSFFLVVNASNSDKDFEWMQKQAEGSGIELKNLSADYALIAIQGPKAYSILSKISGLPENLSYYRFTDKTVNGKACRISRTGYTGEDGFEIYIAPKEAGVVWDALLDAGADDGIAPCGLAVRDLLRIEAGYPLYGHELAEDINPIDAGLKWAVKKKLCRFYRKTGD